MSDRIAYRNFLKGLQLRHFSPQEVISYADQVRNGVKNSLPPKSLWKNIAPTLWLLDNLREGIGLPITLTSIYRSPAYNQAVGGAVASFHMKNIAIDFQVKGMGPTAVANRLKAIRSGSGFKGGIGTYRTFTHVDTRGANRTW